MASAHDLLSAILFLLDYVENLDQRGDLMAAL